MKNASGVEMPKAAQDYFDQAYQQFQKIQDKFGLATTMYENSKWYFKFNQPMKALDTLQNEHCTEQFKQYVVIMNKFIYIMIIYIPCTIFLYLTCTKLDATHMHQLQTRYCYNLRYVQN